MNDCILIDGERFIPARSLLAHTSGLLDVSRVAKIFADPEGWVHGDLDARITPHRLTSNGSFHQVPPWAFTGLAQRAGVEGQPCPVTNLDANIFVEEAAAQRAARDLCHGLHKHGVIAPSMAVWDSSPRLTANQRDIIYEGLPPYRPTKGKTRGRIAAAVAEIETALRDKGISLDRSHMPGTKKLWKAAIEAVDNKLWLAQATMNDHFDKLDMRWGSGTKAETMAPVYDVLGLPMPVAKESQGG